MAHYFSLRNNDLENITHVAHEYKILKCYCNTNIDLRGMTVQIIVIW